MSRNILYIIVLFFGLVFGQDYAWPTSTGQQLTSNFGEFRGDHFHMGIDIRTYQSTGHPLYAVSDGYIYRITTNFRGYGKALYLKTTDGNIALYSHMTKYTSELENRLFDLQKDNQSYFVNQYFTKHEYPINKGDIIGYSGNSGGSMGPHLHFEFRNTNDQPLNPLVYGFPVDDSKPPTFLDLAIIPFNSESKIGASALPKIYRPRQISKTGFVIDDTISVKGAIGLTTRIVDKIPYIHFSYQPQQMVLFVDSIPTFSITYDSLDFREDNFVRTVLGQPSSHIHSEDFQKLYRLDSYPQLLLHPDENSGILNLIPGVHNIEIKAIDAAKNESVLSFTVDVKIDTIHSEQNISLTTSDLDSISLNKSNFVPEFLVHERGALFKVKTDSTYSYINAFIENHDTLFTFPLYEEQNSFVSNLISFDKFEKYANIGLLFVGSSMSKYYYTFQPRLILPDSDQTLFSNDSLIALSINNSFFDTTLAWISDVSSRFYSSRKNRVSPVYNIYPKGIPANTKFRTSFNYDTNYSENLAFYWFDTVKHKWKYVESKADSTSVTAELEEPEIIAVYRDDKLPWIESSVPLANQIYSKDSLNVIKIKVDDILSGIDYSEDNLSIYLNGERLWVAYQPFEKEISFDLLNPLSVGEHILAINIQDRSGNSISKSFKFFVE